MQHDRFSREALAGLDAMQAEKVAREAFDSDQNVRAEFGTVGAATAYARAVARGLVHIREGEPA